MKHKISLIFLLWILLISPQLAGCAELKPIYPVQDSGKRGVGISGWLDNDRVVFYSEQRAQAKPGDGPEGPPIVDAGYYVWDTSTGMLNKDSSLEGAAKLCVQGNVVTFLRKSPSEEKKWLVVTRINGQETVAPLVNAEWFNRFSCRYYDQKPVWIIPGHETLSLLDGHRYLDWTPPEEEKHLLNPPIRYFPEGSEKGVVLPIGTREAWRSIVPYIPFRNAYLLSSPEYEWNKPGDWKVGRQQKTKPRIWWFMPDGQVTKQIVEPRSWMSHEQFYPIKGGLFVTSRGIIDLGNPGVAGGYILKKGTEQKIISGMVDHVSISPDGCRVVFVHDPYDTMYGKDRLNRITVKAINLCQEDRHTR